VGIWTTGAISLLLLLGSGVLMVSHVRAWRAARSADLDGEERTFRRRQFQRRIQTSAMLAVLAVALLAGEMITGWVESYWLKLVYWGAMLLLVGWLALLAVADIVATHYHFSRLRQSYLLEQTRLKAELRRLHSSERNGRGKNLR
jgi:hypothetical protein